MVVDLKLKKVRLVEGTHLSSNLKISGQLRKSRANPIFSPCKYFEARESRKSPGLESCGRTADSRVQPKNLQEKSSLNCVRRSE